MTRILSILLLLALTASAANICVGPSSTGSGSGENWSNVKAWTNTPARGDVWYLRDGSYPAKTFSTAANGTTITIKKATAASHVSATGWSDSMTNAAVLTGATFTTSDWTVDGVTGSGMSVMPMDTERTHYGIWFTNDSSKCITVQPPIANITIRSVYSQSDTNDCISGTGYFLHNSAVQAGTTNIVVSKCLLIGYGQAIRIGENSTLPSPCYGLTFEYNVYRWLYTDSVWHANPINAMWCPIYDPIIRYNYFGDTFGPKCNSKSGMSQTISGNGAPIYRAKIYGNVFDHNWSGRAIISGNCTAAGGAIRDSVVYHNTFLDSGEQWGPTYDEGGGLIGDECSSGNTFMNNLAFNSDGRVNGGVTANYNHRIYVRNDDNPPSYPYESNSTLITNNYNPFTDKDGFNFALLTNTPAGTALAGEYGYDALGNPRTTWTRGAYEFSTGATSNAHISVSSWPTAYPVIAVGGTSNVTVTITNSGNAVLDWTCSVASPFSVDKAAGSLATNVTTNVVFTFSPTNVGDYSATASFGGGGGASVACVGRAYRVSTWPMVCTNHYYAGAWASNSSGRIVHSTTPANPASAGLALLACVVTNPAQYYARMVVVSSSGSANSCWINVNAEPTDDTMCFHSPISTSESNVVVSWQGNGNWQTNEFPTNIWTLDAGTHLFYIRGREANFEIYSVTLVPVAVTNEVPAPAWLTQPVSREFLLGDPAWLECYAQEAAGYTWRHEGTNVVDSASIAGQGTASLLIIPSAATNAGSYVVVATNTSGSITSSVALLTLTNAPVAPTITSAPSDLKIRPAAGGTLSVSASGTAPIQYLWYRDGAYVGAGATITIESATSLNLGSYTAVAENSIGSVTSAPVVVLWMVNASVGTLRVGTP